ncbi:MAG TPA: response regulator [Armatimonadota bacterium]|nr:response regulator [Armatimonadota bacterium]HOP80700.1 response regulator [Armatimonadota bacterium]HPP75735.1 response regulator [Armatimonadota bacterium]
MGKRIMIVDDSMRHRMELKDILLSSGFSIVGEASNGRDAIEMFERTRPDLVMVDARMPNLDGVCTIREIRRKDPDALMIICAGSGEKSSALEAMSAGAVDLCAKPYIQRRVVTVVRRVLAGVPTGY